jgi:hypothetical protein
MCSVRVIQSLGTTLSERMHQRYMTLSGTYKGLVVGVPAKIRSLGNKWEDKVR